MDLSFINVQEEYLPRCTFMFRWPSPEKRCWRSPGPAADTRPWPPWFPSPRCTPSPTPESRSAPSEPPHGPRRGCALRSDAAAGRKTHTHLFRPESLRRHRSHRGEEFKLPTGLGPIVCFREESPSPGSPWQERCSAPPRPPRGCSPAPLC